MTVINQPVTPSPLPQPSVTKPEVNFKGDDANKKIAEAIEKNSDTAKTCATVALATSAATLLPLSVLAYRTGKISKVAEGLEKNTKPIMENVKVITESAKNTMANIEKGCGEMVNSIKSEEWNKLLSEVKNRVADIDGKAVTEELKNSIKELTDATTKKIGETSPETINNLVKTIESKIEALNVQGLSDDAIRLLADLRAKVESFTIKVEAAV